MNTFPVSRAVVVENVHGLHARPAELMVKTALGFESQIEVQRGSERVDGKSILDLLTLGAEQGTELILHACGEDAQEAVDRLAELVESGFAAAYRPELPDRPTQPPAE